MKRFISILVCVLLLLPLVASGESSYEVCVLEVKGIALNAQGKSIELSPSLEVQIGFDQSREHAWLQGSALMGGSPALALQLEYEGGILNMSFDNSKDCAMIEYGDEQLGFLLGMQDSFQMKDALATLAMLKSPELVEQQLSSIPDGAAVQFKKIDGATYQIEVSLESETISGQVSWHWLDNASKPFDLTKKNQVKIELSKGIYADTDFNQVLSQGIAKLMTDPSFAALFATFGQGLAQN